MLRVFIASSIALILSIRSIEPSFARDRCGRDYTGISLPKLVNIYKKSYLSAGFKVVKSAVKNNSATLRVIYQKKGLNYWQALEYEFYLNSVGEINACGSLHEPEEGDPSDPQRITYIGIFSKVNDKANDRITRETAKQKGGTIGR